MVGHWACPTCARKVGCQEVMDLLGDPIRLQQIEDLGPCPLRQAAEGHRGLEFQLPASLRAVLAKFSSNPVEQQHVGHEHAAALSELGEHLSNLHRLTWAIRSSRPRSPSPAHRAAPNRFSLCDRMGSFKRVVERGAGKAGPHSLGPPPPTLGPLPLATWHRLATVGRLLVAVYYWPRTFRRQRLTACAYWPPTIGRLMLVAYDRPLTIGRPPLATYYWPLDDPTFRQIDHDLSATADPQVHNSWTLLLFRRTSRRHEEAIALCSFPHANAHLASAAPHYNAPSGHARQERRPPRRRRSLGTVASL